MSYYELWTILTNWRKEFSAAEFARTFSSPYPRKVLHDMVEKGFLERRERGWYSVRSIGDYAKVRNDVRAGYNLLSTSNMPYALTGVDGVFVWTRGGYNAGRFFGSYPIHLKVLNKDLSKWRGFFSRAGRRSFLSGRSHRETLFGVFYLLYPESSFEAVVVEGLKVEPLKETVKFARKNKYTFQPALETLAALEEHDHGQIVAQPVT